MVAAALIQRYLSCFLLEKVDKLNYGMNPSLCTDGGDFAFSSQGNEGIIMIAKSMPTLVSHCQYLTHASITDSTTRQNVWITMSNISLS